MSKKILWIIVVMIVLISAGVYFVLSQQRSSTLQAITNFEECAKAGYPIMESYPAQCRTPDDRIFTEIIPPPIQLEKIINFEQCATAGGQIMQSYPRQCRSSEGKIFTEFTQ